MLVPGPPSPYTVEMEVWSHRSSYPRSFIIIIIIIIIIRQYLNSGPSP
jgi:hypothetical protein